MPDVPAPPLPRTYVMNSGFISLARCADDYRALLRDLGCLAPTLDTAQVIIMQCELTEAAKLIAAMPTLAKRKLVGLLVWEADRLPSAAVPVLRHFDAIWTPSWYSAKSFVPHHRQVLWLPHVVRRPLAPQSTSQAQINTLLGPRAPCTLLQVGRLDDRRKGGEQVVAAVGAAARDVPGLTLVRKMRNPGQTQKPLIVQRHGPVVDLLGYLDDDALAALYARCDFVISGHHGEAWGLTLSEAMAAGVPPIAPNYSGNLAFMQHATGWLIPTHEAPIREADSHTPPAAPLRHVHAPMRWGYALPGQMRQVIVRAARSLGTPTYAAMADLARRQSRAYDGRHVRVMLRHALQHLAGTPAPNPSLRG